MHWTQTPEGRKRMAAIGRMRKRSRNTGGYAECRTCGAKLVSNSSLWAHRKHNPSHETVRFSRPGAATCKTCHVEIAGSSGIVEHYMRHPDHVIVKANGQIASSKYKTSQSQLAPLNGTGRVSSELLGYAFRKMREEINSELDRLEAQIKQGQEPTRSATRRPVFVAR